MMILALDTSSRSASCALLDGEKLVAQSFQNNGLTHSQTIMPMIEAMLQNAGVARSSIGLVAVTTGPGSFTGLRIGVAAAQGLAWALEIPCCGVSSLEAAAQGLAHTGQTVCAVMDARCSQVYNAVFSSDGETLSRQTPDRALAMAELYEEIQKTGALLVGDGAELCYNEWKNPALTLAPAHLRYPAAWAVARIARDMAAQGLTIPPGALLPVYLRLPQAERERQNQMK